MTEQEIINETIEYYTHNKRAVLHNARPDGGNICTYLTNDGRKCAVSRCMTEEGVAWAIDKGLGSVASFNDIELEQMENYLMDKYKGHSIEFWTVLQELHDRDSYWKDTGGLTDSGKEIVESFLKHRTEESAV